MYFFNNKLPEHDGNGKIMIFKYLVIYLSVVAIIDLNYKHDNLIVTSLLLSIFSILNNEKHFSKFNNILV